MRKYSLVADGLLTVWHVWIIAWLWPLLKQVTAPVLLAPDAKAWVKIYPMRYIAGLPLAVGNALVWGLLLLFAWKGRGKHWYWLVKWGATAAIVAVAIAVPAGMSLGQMIFGQSLPPVEVSPGLGSALDYVAHQVFTPLMILFGALFYWTMVQLWLGVVAEKINGAAYMRERSVAQMGMAIVHSLGFGVLVWLTATLDLQDACWLATWAWFVTAFEFLGLLPEQLTAGQKVELDVKTFLIMAFAVVSYLVILGAGAAMLLWPYVKNGVDVFVVW